MNILILTGAGISAESGIATFRGADGLWEGHSITDVATPEGFRRDPELVHRFYNQRRRQLIAPDIQPNAAHKALARWQRWHADHDGGDFLLVTQNIDDLHVRGGSQDVLAMHGELLKARDIVDQTLYPWRTDLGTDTPHPDAPEDASRRGMLRPHVVWFGEMPIGLDAIADAARRADVFVAIGTSGVVYPAAGIVDSTGPHCRKIELNLEPTPVSDGFDEKMIGPATQTVPELVTQMCRPAA